MKSKTRRYCKAYPDEKGIETKKVAEPSCPLQIIAKPIPMKRELKRHCFGISSAVGFINCKAYPDEKGIETKGDCMTLSPAQWNCKAYPDEKGIETDIVRHALAGDHIAKPIPMKRELKLFSVSSMMSWNFIAKPIPMKRELKLRSRACARSVGSDIAKPIPMKRELKLRVTSAQPPKSCSIAKPIPMKRELKHLEVVPPDGVV